MAAFEVIGDSSEDETSLNTKLRADFTGPEIDSLVYEPSEGITWADLLVDLASDSFLESSASLSGDGTHPNDAGHTEYAHDLLPAVQSFLYSISASPTTAERGEPGQTLTLSGTGIDFSTAVATDFTLTGSTITNYNQTTQVLTFTASSSTGTLTLTHVPTGATFSITCVDTTPPPDPTGVSSTGKPTTTDGYYSFTLSWNGEEDTHGGPVTYRIYHDGTELTTAPGQSGTTYAITGATIDDIFSVRAEDPSGNISGTTNYTFQIPMPTNPFSTTYPTIAISGQSSLGPLTAVDDLTYKYINVPNVRGPVTVTLVSPYANSEIRYTLNGKNPNPSSRLYSGPLVYRQNASGSDRTTIKARVYNKTNNNVKSKIIRLEFRIV